MSSLTSQLNKEVVRAGAGAGKTTNLTQKVVEFAKSHRATHGQWPRMVVTTFTRKATQELRERLITLACKDGDQDLLDFFSSRSSLQISTLHGVFSLFLRRYGHLLNMDPGFAIVSDEEASRLSRKVLREVLFTDSEHESLLGHFTFKRLNELVLDYDRVSTEVEGLKPAGVEALKTAVRFQSLVLSARLEEVATEALKQVDNAKWISYLEGVEALARDIQGGGDVVPSAWLERYQALGRKPSFMEKNPPFDPDLHEEFKEAVEDFKTEFQRPEYAPEVWPRMADLYDRFDRLASAFCQRFRDAKQAGGKLQMSDLELITLRVLRQEPKMAEVFAGEWDYWLIDEYQDTSPLQVEILRQLVGDRACYVVGDPQQSIYLFRGARSEVFSQLEQEVEGGGGRLNELKVNYRSRPELLCFFNDFFTRYSPHFRRMEPKACDSRHPEAVVARFARAGETSAEDTEKHAVLHHVRRLIEDGWRFEDICILARTNRALGEFAQFLSENGVPTHIHSSQGFFGRREVVDALAILKFLVNPHDNFNLILLLRTPWFRAPDGSLAEALRTKPKSLWSALDANPPAWPALERLRRLRALIPVFGVVEAFEHALVESGLLDFSHAHDSTGRRESNIWKLIETLRDQSRRPGFNIVAFITNAAPDWTRTEGQEDSEAVAALEPNRVNLMTIHASKGLKFTHVILTGAGKKPRLSSSSGARHLLSLDENSRYSFPVPLGEDSQVICSPLDRGYLLNFDRRELEECDRLLYVAFTRAVESVFVTWTEPLERDSWMYRARWDFSEGPHPGGEYGYVVEAGPWPARTFEAETASAQTVRPRLQVGSSGAPFETKFSVSAVLKSQESTTPARSSSGGAVLQRRLQISNDGTLIHRLMEIIKYREDAEWGELVRRWFPDRAEDVLRALHYVQTLQDPPLAEIIRRGRVEWGFQLHTQRGILEGQIDLWGEGPDGRVWLVDYKSGSSDYKEKAFRQLQLYSLALRRFGCHGPIQMAVVYPLLEKCFTAPAPSEEECQAVFTDALRP